MTIEQLKNHYEQLTTIQLLKDLKTLKENYDLFGDPVNDYFSKINYYYEKRILTIENILKGRSKTDSILNKCFALNIVLNRKGVK